MRSFPAPVPLLVWITGVLAASKQSAPQRAPAAPETARPVARMHHAVAYDPKSKHVVLFGGATNEGRTFDDLWRWDGKQWTLVARTGAPAAGHLLFGDDRGDLFLVSGVRGATSKWNGTQWAPVGEEPMMRRFGAAGAYDTTRRKFVAHGGSPRPREVSGDTLEFDGAAWKQVATNGPSARMTASMAYDAARGVALLFGGDAGPALLGDTWEWNGTRWTRKS